MPSTLSDDSQLHQICLTTNLILHCINATVFYTRSAFLFREEFLFFSNFMLFFLMWWIRLYRSRKISWYGVLLLTTCCHLRWEGLDRCYQTSKNLCSPKVAELTRKGLYAQTLHSFLTKSSLIIWKTTKSMSSINILE